MRVPLTICDHIDRAELVHPDRIAVHDEPDGPGSLGALTYASLAARARGLARRLDELGLPRGARVAICSPNSARFLVALFGVSGYGRVLVPVNFRLTSEEVAYILEHSGAEVLLVDPDQDATLGPLPVKERVVLDGVADAAWFAEAAPGDLPRYRSDDADQAAFGDGSVEDATASINYTSGTTARPKGVQLTHRNLWLNAATFGWHLGVSDRDTYLHTLPLFHCNGWGMPYALTGMGARHVLLRKVDGEEILRRVDAHGVTLLCGAPAVVAMVLDAAAARKDAGVEVPGRDRVRIVVAGAPPPSKVIERVEVELGWEFVQIYGLTETAPLLTVNRAPEEWDALEPGERARLLSRAGVPAVGVRIAVDDEGEVCARANHVFAGYWEQRRESAAALKGITAGGTTSEDPWFHTGDGGVLEDAFVVISDRKKDVIITGGENVSSIEVEDCLYQHPAVAECAVIGVPDDKWGETIKALVVLRPGVEAPTEEQLRAFCKERMAGFKCPTSIEVRDSLVRTATGKLQKFKLRAPYWEGRDRQVS